MKVLIIGVTGLISTGITRLLVERGDFAVTSIRPAWTYGEGGTILHTFGWNSTYLDRLVINPSSIQLQGKSANAQQLIEKVNESPYLDAAAFRGSTRLDVRSGLEIFEINAQVSVPEDKDDAGS